MQNTQETEVAMGSLEGQDWRWETEKREGLGRCSERITDKISKSFHRYCSYSSRTSIQEEVRGLFLETQYVFMETQEEISRRQLDTWI
jgi:hypothetical protein